MDGYRCPACGGADCLHVQAKIWVRITNNGTDVDGDHEWDGDCEAWCDCGWEGQAYEMESDDPAEEPEEEEDEPEPDNHDDWRDLNNSEGTD